MKAKNVIEVTDFTKNEWERLISQSLKYKKNRHSGRTLLRGKLICLLFDSASLRTKTSFEVATFLLGGETYFIDIRDIVSEYGEKREEIHEIIDTLDKMIDCYVIRDYSQKFLDVLKRKNCPPFINGFSQTGHPSQALADMSVIKWKKGKLKGLNYAGVCPSTGSGVMESFIYSVLLLGENIKIITPTGKFLGKNPDFYL